MVLFSSHDLRFDILHSNQQIASTERIPPIQVMGNPDLCFHAADEEGDNQPCMQRNPELTVTIVFREIWKFFVTDVIAAQSRQE
jgi:hypothetical protein